MALTLSEAITMEGDQSADRIRRRMAELRRELTDDVQDVRRSARAMADPGMYLRRFPWASVAVALGIGYLLVPKRKEVIHPDPELLAKYIKDKRVRVETQAGEPAPKSLLKRLLAMGLAAAARTGANYMVQRMASTAAPPPAARQPVPSYPES